MNNCPEGSVSDLCRQQALSNMAQNAEDKPTAPWLYKAVTRWRPADDPFFDEGNKVCRVTTKQTVADVEEDEGTDVPTRFV